MAAVCDCVAFLLNQNCWVLWETKSKKLVFRNTSVIIYYTAGLLLWRLVVRKHNYYYKRRVRSTWPAIGHQHFCFISHEASTWCCWLRSYITNTIQNLSVNLTSGLIFVFVDHVHNYILYNMLFVSSWIWNIYVYIFLHN